MIQTYIHTQQVNFLWVHIVIFKEEKSVCVNDDDEDFSLCVCYQHIAYRIVFVENCHDALVGEVREVVNMLIGIRNILRTFNFNNASQLQAV